MNSYRKDTFTDRAISCVCTGILAYLTGLLYWVALNLITVYTAGPNSMELFPGPQWLIVFAVSMAALGFIFPATALNILGWLWARFASFVRLFN